MKTITTQEHDHIIEVRNAGLTSLPPGIFEKDLLITEVLQTIAATNNKDIQLVFCGGTCLSKAHGLTQRMSEDIDFKVILPKTFHAVPAADN
jgi:predicted nucleotidyltransferase component of viral defense system